MRMLLILLASLGTALATGGLLAFIFGGWLLHGPLSVKGFGPLSGLWSPPDYCFLGALLAAIGSGFVMCGLLGLRERSRS